MSEKFDKDFTLTVKIKECNEVFLEGQDAGVFASVTYTFTETQETYDSQIIQLALDDRKKDFMESMVEVEIREDE